MENLGLIFWLIGLSMMTFFAIAWLLDINNRQRDIQNQLDQISKLVQEPDLVEMLKSAAEGQPVTREQWAHIQSQLSHHLQRVGLVRFQAFSDVGGDQSFALALTDQEGNGVVVASIFAREGTRIYAKPLEAWSSPIPLSAEEQEAIQQAQNAR